jgi:pyruvate-formate lyase-activating enzyme
LLHSVLWEANRRVGAVVPYRVRLKVYRWIYPPGTAKPPALYVDVVGSCNLRCPSCPVGNMGPLNKSGLMDVEVFEKIVHKATTEFGVRSINLYNWAEPLLHPRLPELIRIAKRRGVMCNISSNLNLMRNVDEILKAKPDEFRISLSGFTQKTYGETHAGGDIEKVKKNMVALSEAKLRTRNKATTVHVYFHKYKHNLDEVAQMREFARSLGFQWLEEWAVYMPLERLLEVAEGKMTEDQRRFVEGEFALPIEKAIDAARGFRDARCTLLEDQIVLDAKGNMNLCCSVYDYDRNRLGYFLDMTAEDVARAKTKHPTCERCASHGLHMFSTYFENPPLK